MYLVKDVVYDLIVKTFITLIWILIGLGEMLVTPHYCGCCYVLHVKKIKSSSFMLWVVKEGLIKLIRHYILFLIFC